MNILQAFTDFLRGLPPAQVTRFVSRAKKATFSFILLCLIVFVVFGGLYLYVPAEGQKHLPQHISNSNFTAQPITCGYSASGQYGASNTSLYLFLLTTIFFVRKIRWLSTAMAAYVMTYSGVAAIHLMVLFAFNDRVAKDKQPDACTHVNFGTSNETIPICAGTFDPDYIIAGSIVGQGLLAVLPAATWSETFKSAEGAPILVLWTALLAAGHIFFNVITPNSYVNYQICSAGFTEPLPRLEYHTVTKDAIWFEKLNTILRNDSPTTPSCLYNCFTPTERYLGRQPEEIGIFDATLSNRYTSPARRGTGITFWLLYAVLSFVVVLLHHGYTWRSLRRQDRFRWSLERYDSCNHNIWNQVKDKRRQILRMHRPFGISACTRCRVEMTVQVLGVLSYLGYVGICLEEFTHIPNAEPFSAVGQWGVVASIVIVLIATGISQVAYILGGGSVQRHCGATVISAGHAANAPDGNQAPTPASEAMNDTPLVDVPRMQSS